MNDIIGNHFMCKIGALHTFFMFIAGVREYVENLELRTELAVRKALIENMLCKEQKNSQSCFE